MNKISIFFLFLLPHLASCVNKKIYIVYFGEHSGDKASQEIEETHVSYLSSVKESEQEAKDSLLYSYKNSVNGFSALLTPQQASELSQLEEVISVIESHPRKYSVQTTRSWEFVGLDEGEGNYSINNHFDLESDLPSRAGYGKGIIIGMLDSGVWPESQSFSDEGMGPVPESWKGICQSGPNFNASHCNKKIIGARYYIKAFEKDNGPLNATQDSRSPRDMDGHGTHTASTVAGSWVHNVSAYGGFARGTASGGAPLAHLAIYKACWAIPNQEKVKGNVCYEADMLAAIDDAIGDGVHVLSMSIGSSEPVPYDQDGIAIGAFHAAKKDIVVVCAAGNAGPAPGTLSNPAPWIMTVGASTVDRAFLGPVKLGNGKIIMGQTVTPYKLDKNYPLVYAADVAAPGVLHNQTNQCLPNSLSVEKVKGKIVLCMRGAGIRVGKGMEVKRAGGVGIILGNSPANGSDVSVDAHVLPGTAVTSDQAIEILDYIKSTKNPTATIGKAKTVLHYSPAPSIAAFSSRGPNVIDPNILKPDILGPGVNILAAWSEASPPTQLSADNRTVKFNIDSGTSMACPHVAAAAALLKAIHPTWTSAAIRSAIMTTAWMGNNKGEPITDTYGKPSTPFHFGSGQFRPAKAADPGLVYDATYKDYVQYICNHGHKNINPKYKCPKQKRPAHELNYPSIAIPKLNGTVTIRRSVRNVGTSKSVYAFETKPPMGFSVEVEPGILYFDRVNQKRIFTITISANPDIADHKRKENKYAFGWYAWTNNFHHVRSPIAVSLA